MNKELEEFNDKRFSWCIMESENVRGMKHILLSKGEDVTALAPVTKAER